MPVVISTETDTPFPYMRLYRAAERLLRYCGLRDQELSILLVDDHRIAQINSHWLNRTGPTNVISFPQRGQGLVGDIVISVERARREATESGTTWNNRLTELLVHGLVHLLGEDHELGEEAARRMRKREQELISHLLTEDIMADLCINVDHIATIRQARGGNEPDPVVASGIVELAGADGVVVHLREDRRHIQDRDVKILRDVVKGRLTLEMAATDEMIGIAGEIQPDIVTLVPEKRQELTTEGGLDVLRLEESVTDAVSRLHGHGIPVSLFVDPEEEQVQAAARTGAECIEIHTGRYADAEDAETEDQEFQAIARMASIAVNLGLRVHAGHGLNYRNTTRVAAISEISEFSIGHAIIARAALVGLDQAVREMLRLVKGV